MRKRVGISVATTLMVVAVLLSLGLTLLAVSLHHLSVSSRLGHLERARQAAESVVALAIEKLLADTGYGCSRHGREDLEMMPRANYAGPGRLTFVAGPFPYSTNNLAGDAAVAGYGGRVVPPHSAQLIGVCTSGGVTRSVLALLSQPPFPYAVACNGPLTSGGNLRLASVASSQDLLDNRLGTASLVSNGTGPQALVLGPNTDVAGDLRSAGDIVLDVATTRVRGEILSRAAPVAIPRIDVASLDPIATGRSQVAVEPSAQLDNPAYQGFVRRSGDLNVRGGLTLDNGVLYVDGDLTVEGGVRGVGAVLVTGRVNLEGGADLSSDAHLALVSGGEMRLRGQNADTSFFQGLIYSGGSFSADDITVVGSLIVQPPTGAPSVLNDARLVQCPALSRLKFSTTATSQLTFSSAGQFSGSQSGNFSGGSATLAVSFQDPTYTVQGVAGLTALAAAQRILSLLDQRGLAGIVTQAEILQKLAGLTVSTDSGGPVTDFVLDPSLFLRFEERVRIAAWEEF